MPCSAAVWLASDESDYIVGPCLGASRLRDAPCAKPPNRRPRSPTIRAGCRPLVGRERERYWRNHNARSERSARRIQESAPRRRSPASPNNRSFHTSTHRRPKGPVRQRARSASCAWSAPRCDEARDESGLAKLVREIGDSRFRRAPPPDQGSYRAPQIRRADSSVRPPRSRATRHGLSARRARSRPKMIRRRSLPARRGARGRDGGRDRPSRCKNLHQGSR